MSHEGRARRKIPQASGVSAALEDSGCAAGTPPRDRRLKSEPPYARLARMHNAAVEAARRHANTKKEDERPYRYTEFVNASTEFHNALARELGRR